MSAQKTEHRREIKDHERILAELGRIKLFSELVEKHEGHYKYEFDLEVIVYGRTYTGGRVGPYARLWKYESGAELIKKDEWAGNSFYVLVDGRLEVFDNDPKNPVREIEEGEVFGEMAIIEGDQRSATVKVKEGCTATVLELHRPALRLLQKLPNFKRIFDKHYQKHGLKGLLSNLGMTRPALALELSERLEQIARFKVYGRPHTLLQEGELIEQVYLINKGWVEVTHGGMATSVDANFAADRARYLGAGNCFGLEAITRGARTWPYGVTIQARTEVLEISIADLNSDPQLRQVLIAEFGALSDVDEDNLQKPIADPRGMQAASKEISTGIIDGTNLLVMDMELCVRCGNCSLACHHVHGQSRLVRHGIEIERPHPAQSARTQYLLAPQVCLHCQDPECLTGCPTGAIGRHPGGEIDIDPKTCIGCGDCATQCPYNAISLIPKKQPANGWHRCKNFLWHTLKKLLWLTPQPLPARTDETEEKYLAVKCNLCKDAPFNRSAAKPKAYSCEDNCPTGALVRVKPLEYFSETNGQIGKGYQGQTHITGQNIHQEDRAAQRWHTAGACAIVGTLITLIWAAWHYNLDEHLWGTRATVRWLTGWAGLAGVLGAASYLIRKQIYRWRFWALRYWVLFHAYLGAITALVLLTHGGWYAGGLLTSLLMVTFDLTILSGLFGVACYLAVPRLLTRIEEEPLLLDDLLARRAELEHDLAVIETKDKAEALRQLIEQKVPDRLLSLSYLLSQYLHPQSLTHQLKAAREEFEQEVNSLELRPDERRLLVQAVETTAILVRVNALIYLHRILKLWIAPHVVSTVLMLLLMCAHIYQVLHFAVR